MTDLAINISSVPVKASASKQSANTEATQQDAQDFGNVLSRKVADSTQPVEPRARSTEDKSQKSSEPDNTEAVRVDEVDSALPGDMLTALLVQQNQSVAVQSDTSTQPGFNAQPDTNAPLAFTAQPDTGTQPAFNALPDTSNQPGFNTQPVTSMQPGINLQPATNAQSSASAPTMPAKDISATLALTTATGKLPNTVLPVLDPASTQISSPFQENNDFVQTFKAPGIKDLTSPTSNLPFSTSLAIEVPVSAQQLPTHLTATTAPSSPSSINTSLTQPAWGDEFSQKITWMATQRNQSAELHLNPPQLGPLDVVLKMNGDQATAMFTSPHAAVRDAIEQALPKLREMLADSGITLGNAMVSDQAAKNNQDNSSPKATPRMPTSPEDDAKEGASIQEIRVSSRSRHNGMVDTFA